MPVWYGSRDQRRTRALILRQTGSPAAARDWQGARAAGLWH
jgi:hypothetical protein